MTICVHCAKEFEPSRYLYWAATSKNIKLPDCDRLCSQECIDLYVEDFNKQAAESGFAFFGYSPKSSEDTE